MKKYLTSILLLLLTSQYLAANTRYRWTDSVSAPQATDYRAIIEYSWIDPYSLENNLYTGQSGVGYSEDVSITGDYIIMQCDLVVENPYVGWFSLLQLRVEGYISSSWQTVATYDESDISSTTTVTSDVGFYPTLLDY